MNNREDIENFNNLDIEEENKLLKQLIGASIGSQSASNLLLPLELTKIWGRNRSGIKDYELIQVYRYFEKELQRC